MQDLMAAWQADVAKQPQWVQYWMDIMVVVLGLIVGFIVIALFLPLIKLLNDLS